MLFIRCDVFSDLLQYTHTEKCNPFYAIKIQMVYWRIFGAWKKKNKSADVIWRGFEAICVCVYPLVDDAQQPIKIHAELTLLYKNNFRFQLFFKLISWAFRTTFFGICLYFLRFLAGLGFHACTIDIPTRLDPF